MNDITPTRRPQTADVKPAPAPTPPAPEPVQPAPARPAVEPLAPFKKAKKRSLKWLWLSLLTLLVLLLAAAAAAWWWYSDNLQARSNSGEHIAVNIQSGQSADAVAADLEQKGLIRNALAAVIYMRLNNKTNIKTGNYVFAANQTPQEIIEWINDGRVDTFKVTIIPGQTLAKIKTGLVKAGYQAEDIDAAFAATYDHPLLANKPAGASLEGYVYPETYFVSSDTTIQQLLVITFDEFQKQLDKNNYTQQLAAMGFNIHQGLTLASIVEKEVSNSADRRQVAQVFEKRLRDGMVLGSDVTYIYGASLLGVEPSPALESPYNTRKVKGLPPTPISNFSLSALEAVVKPASGSYVYFVAGDDGNTYFAYTLAEHEANISKYCHELCGR